MNTDLLLESVLKVKHIEIQAGIWRVKSETDQTHLMHYFETNFGPLKSLMKICWEK